jgi:gamma-glutamyl phosphate reductase
MTVDEAIKILKVHSNHKEDVMTTQQKRQELKAAGAKYTNNIGWAFLDLNTGTCWFDNSSYNGTKFLGANTNEAHEELTRIDVQEQESMGEW